MSKLSAIESLIMFNQRVLSLGQATSDEKYTMNELKKALTFNQIFINNMDEIFRNQKKYIDHIDKYIMDLKTIHSNIYCIIDKIQEIDDTIKIDISDDNSFECRFAILNFIKTGLLTNVIDKNEFSKYDFNENIIYYIISIGDTYIISYLDPKSRLYQIPISYKFNGYIKYWKTDVSLLSYIKNNYNDDETSVNGVIMKFTKSSDSHEIVKIDIAGNDDDINCIYDQIHACPDMDNKFIIKNQFIYMNDIDQIISASSLYQNIITKSDVFSANDSKQSFSLSDIFNDDILVEYPAESFDLYLRLLHLASIDKRVESISITLYRIGDNPIIYYILRDAVRRGVQVHVNLELRASGEKINQFWANEMRAVGIDVTHYADGYLKIHCKLTLIKFKDGKMISQIGTGNYHSQTTALYTDLSLMTSDDAICSQISILFGIILNGNKKAKFNKNLLITRYNAREVLKDLILEQAALGPNGLIQIKCNSLDDNKISKYLDKAALSGCKIQLIIRGICTWVPPEDNLNKNVTIKSIVWDKLEHSRVYCFGTIDPIVYLGSLDLITRKLDNRIETLVKITNRNTLTNLCNYMTRYNNFNGYWHMTYEDNKIVYKN